MAMARRGSPAIRPVFVSMSQAVPVVGKEGFPWEYVPSRESLGVGVRRWNLRMTARFTEILRRERPAALVFDGTYPYDAVLAAADAVPETRLVWSRRGLWRAGGEGDQLARSSRFDLIIEPGDFAEEEDRGATAGRTDALRVGPITLLDEGELLPREQATAALGVDPDRPVALITLGADNRGNLHGALELFVHRLLREPELQVVLTRPVIATRLEAVSEQVHCVSVYPIARYARAVDFAVSAVGYNSFHEFVRLAVPTVFVANPDVPLDDQPARSRWAARVGAALDLTEATEEAVDRAVTVLLDPGQRARLGARCRELDRPNGGFEAIAAIERLVSGTAATQDGATSMTVRNGATS